MPNEERDANPPAAAESECSTPASELRVTSDFDFDRIVAETFVRKVEFHQTLGSTNDRGLELTERPDCECPVVVLAESQTQGRGRGENQWWSAEGSLTFSLVVDCDRFSLTPENRPKASLTVGLAMCETLSELLSDVHIGLKWPNDVFLNGRKTCGILIETRAAPANRLVIGVGLNVNNSLSAAPDAIREIATSLIDVAGQSFALPDVLIRLIGQIELNLHRLSVPRDDLRTRWRRFCVLRGQTVILDVNNRQVVGECQGVDRDGALLLKTGSGTKRFFSGIIAGIM
ncbi:MAG: biotin--[acetyl-CoA-carboxylase] ligase [Planctomycetaceae bacterium]|jgi:BirA family transcriptional regulator, biotin operon repressor / biotin---[acetyl-CoA-carboxylase] ligase|nr:biotin--[acetyl-CoA-carboxylase] ligase [Planctomycetaceae bacterium]MBT6157306.1 biotin--[acetyl-CoA-carboxylase] ligase [Planctomycetaceae bacterium]MBT6487688.1 biotin--[acetyl-CoA-carboxylase] ligase [Planctomycetaceae bacterium]MBT6495724.1 biotin--[acetyl-CoA-carboxylase] ligase [Planctomycetaceae bacterium]